MFVNNFNGPSYNFFSLFELHHFFAGQALNTGSVRAFYLLRMLPVFCSATNLKG